MSSGAQLTFSEHRFIEGALENRRVGLFLVFRRRGHHLDQGTLGEELLGLGVRDDMLVLVPLAAFEEHAVDVAAIRRFLLDVIFR